MYSETPDPILKRNKSLPWVSSPESLEVWVWDRPDLRGYRIRGWAPGVCGPGRVTRNPQSPLPGRAPCPAPWPAPFPLLGDAERDGRTGGQREGAGGAGQSGRTGRGRVGQAHPQFLEVPAQFGEVQVLRIGVYQPVPRGEVFSLSPGVGS
jgi:hypothetical protein